MNVSSDLFVAVRIPFKDWLDPLPHREGERVLWANGTTHNFPERDEEFITVLRRSDGGVGQSLEG